MNSKQRHFVAVILISFLGLVGYLSSLRNGFVWDDNFQITRNPYIHAGQPWSRLLTSDVWGYVRGGQVGMSNYYRPMQMLTYRVVAETAGLTPSAYHAASILLNILAALTAYALMFQLAGRWSVALAGAILFVTHPIHSEAVLWIAALTELGCALFYFLAFWLFLLAHRAAPEKSPQRKKLRKREIPLPVGASSTRRNWLIAASAACAFIALLWKEMALTFPVVVGAYVFVTAPDAAWTARFRHAITRSLPYWAAIAAYVPVRIAVLGYFSIVQHGWVLTPFEYVLSTIELVTKYWLKLFLPLQLNTYHVFHPARTLWEPRAVASIIFLLAAIAAILWAIRRWPLPAFCATWVFLTLAPVLNIRGVGENVFTERYLYIPSFGFCLLIALVAGSALQRLAVRTGRTAAIVALALVATLGTAMTIRRIPAWESDFALFSDAVAKSPSSALMHSSLAQIYRDERFDLEEARREYVSALLVAHQETPPNLIQMANARVGLSSVYARQGNLQLALNEVNQALVEDDGLPAAHVAKGIVLLQMGRLDEAQTTLEQAHHYFPYDEVVLNGLGVIALAKRQYPVAVDYFKQTVQFVPQYADGYNNLGRSYIEMNDLDHAIPAFVHAVELAPQNAMFHTNYGVALARAGRYPEAHREFDRALAIDPNFVSAQQNLQLLKRFEQQQPPPAPSH